GEHEKYQGFKTPSGKIELYSETLENQGHDPLPTFKEPKESIRSEKAEKFPLILTTGSRLLPFTHSQMRNIPKLKKLYKAKHSTQQCFAEINPVTAGKFDIKNGEEVKITTQRGEIKATAKVTEDIIERVVNIPHGWNKGNVNILTDNEPADPITGAPDLKSELCRISKARNF
ncbi:molybdopterin oxidoreductase, partial [candidate division MSBL1 archaeon SCGC-AAA259I09]